MISSIIFSLKIITILKTVVTEKTKAEISERPGFKTTISSPIGCMTLGKLTSLSPTLNSNTMKLLMFIFSLVNWDAGKSINR